MNYTEQANDVLRIAKNIAKELDHPYVGTEHLLLGLRKVYTGVAGQVLAISGVDEEKILKVVDELVSPVGSVALAHNPEISPRLASAWLTIPMLDVREPCFTSIVTREVITTVDMNFGR